MKVKVEKVNVGLYDYDSIVVEIDNKKTEIVFKKENKVSQYEGKEIELVKEKDVYKIKAISATKEK